MPDKQLDCVIWCPRCRIDKYEVWRIPVSDGDGVYVHATVPASIPVEAKNRCECGTSLLRK